MRERARCIVTTPASFPHTATMSKEPTRYQYSNKLSYQAHVPAFLQRLQSRVAGGAEHDEEEDDEFEYDDSGRPPIPKRPPIPTRPEDEPGSADEDDGDEAPQIVVLKEGKHLSEREVENEKRKGASAVILRMACVGVERAMTVVQQGVCHPCLKLGRILRNLPINSLR